MNTSIIVTWNNEEQIILLKDIVYIESVGRNREINLASGKVVFNKYSINHFEKKLNQYGFVKSYASFLVNTRYIKKVDKNDICLTFNRNIPISKGRLDIVKKVFINSVSERVL